VRDWCDRVAQLFKPQLTEKAIRFTATVHPDGLEVTADNDLLDQVLINLVKNAIEAVQQTEHPVISLCGAMDLYGLPVIKVTDNGSGIKKELLDNIFIPFFTTKSNGSGIGLSLSRQIMRLHGGSITASVSEGQTVFTLKFK